jgi:hypothetical protein
MPRQSRGLGLTSITERLRMLGGGDALMASEITVLIADDHPIFRRGLREVI